MTWAVRLTGDHESIARAELEAVAGPVQWLGPLVGLVQANEADLARLGFLREAGKFVGHGHLGTQSSFAPLSIASARAGSHAVVREFIGGKDARANGLKHAWGAAVSSIHPIDLSNPDHTLVAWVHEGWFTASWRAMLGAKDHDLRGVEHRAHFSPVSLPPRIARALVHLTGCRPGQTIYDPFCGTGGIAMEAAISGYHVLASDLDPWMVQGTLTTLADAAAEPLDADVFVADIGDTPDLVGTVDGIVVDMPYGGASTTNKEALAALYGRAFTAFAKLLLPGSRAVIGHADPALLAPITDHGFEVEAVHDHYVHKSMTRRFAVVKRLQ